MKLARRELVAIGGGLAAALCLPGRLRAMPVETIEMQGTARGERIWFEPRGLHVRPGTVLRFVNRDAGNSHTATAYHPDLYGRQLRIPRGATPWDSDFLLPGEAFEVALPVVGVYDYYCIPHEMAGMVGRIVVGDPGDPDWTGPAPVSDDLEPETFAALPDVEDILASGRVGREGRS
ncbi:MAG: hypothetical protein KDJ80_13030 [Nitratireductor sp.]|nr:hypothetical protein [Nitratireductor sp.]